MTLTYDKCLYRTKIGTSQETTQIHHQIPLIRGHIQLHVLMCTVVSRIKHIYVEKTNYNSYSKNVMLKAR